MLIGLSKKDLRWDFYPSFLKLMKNGFLVEACLLMLSTWNFARFRYVSNNFNLTQFKKTLESIKPLLVEMNKENFRTIDFNKYGEEIKMIFKKLSDIKGVEKTGSSKLMHLMAPNIFVMWDTYIREYYKFKKGDENDYLAFLKLMQQLFKHDKNNTEKTLAKLIDEHNYRKITMLKLKK